MKQAHSFSIELIWDNTNLAEMGEQPKPIASRAVWFYLYPYISPVGHPILFWVFDVNREELDRHPGALPIFKDAVEQYGADAMQNYGPEKIIRLLCLDEFNTLQKRMYDQALGELGEDTYIKGTALWAKFNVTPHVFKLEDRHITFVLWVADGPAFPTPDNLAELERGFYRHFRNPHERDGRVINRVLSKDEFKDFQKCLLFLLDSPAGYWQQ